MGLGDHELDGGIEIEMVEHPQTILQGTLQAIKLDLKQDEGDEDDENDAGDLGRKLLKLFAI